MGGHARCTCGCATQECMVVSMRARKVCPALLCVVMSLCQCTQCCVPTPGGGPPDAEQGSGGHKRGLVLSLTLDGFTLHGTHSLPATHCARVQGASAARGLSSPSCSSAPLSPTQTNIHAWAGMPGLVLALGLKLMSLAFLLQPLCLGMDVQRIFHRWACVALRDWHPMPLASVLDGLPRRSCWRSIAGVCGAKLPLIAPVSYTHLTLPTKA